MRIGQSKRKAILAAAVGVIVGPLGSHFARSAYGQDYYTWDPSQTGTGSDGSGNWDTSNLTNTVWSYNNVDQIYPTVGDDNTSIAVFGDGGTAGTVTVDDSSGSVYADGIQFNNVSSGSYTITGGTITTGAGDIIFASSTVSATINSVIAGPALNVTGGGTLTLGNTANTFTGGVTVNGSQVDFTTDGSAAGNNLGASGNVTVENGGFLVDNSVVAQNAGTRALIFSTGGGTLDIATAYNAGGKWTVASVGGSGSFTKTGGGDLTITGASSSTGNWNIAGGFVEVDSNTGLGTSTSPVLLSNGAEVSIASASTIANNFTINNSTSGTLGVDNTATGSYGGTITDNGALTLELGYFYNTTNANISLTSTSTLTGSGTLTLEGGGSGTLAGLSNPSGQLLSVSGNDSTYGGVLNIGAGYNLSFGNAGAYFASASNVTVTSTATALGGIGISFDPNSAPAAANVGLPAAGTNFTDDTSTYGGVLSINGNAAIYNTPINLSTFGNGNWYLGSATSNVGTINTTITPGNGNTYRLGGGGGTIVINSNLADFGGTNLVVGATAGTVNGGGTVVLNGTNNAFTGTTTINQGTLALASVGALGSGGSYNANVADGGNLEFGFLSGTLTLGGTLSGTGGITMTGSAFGTVDTHSTALVDLTGPNSLTGAVTLNQGTIEAQSSTALGTGGITLNSGTLQVAATGAGSLNVTAATATAATALTFAGGAYVELTANGGNTASFSLGTGSSTGALVRGGHGTLVVEPTGGTSASNLGVNESLIVNGTTPAVTNGMVAPYIVGANNLGNLSGDYLTYVPASGLVITTYGDTNFTAPSATLSELATGTNTVSSPTSVYALQNSGTITLSSSLTVTSGGIILNGGTISSGGTVAFGAAEGLVYASLQGGTIGSPITGTGGLTVFGPGSVTLGNSANTFTGGINIEGGTLAYSALAALHANTVTFNGGTLDYTTAATANTPEATTIYVFGAGGGTIEIDPIFNAGPGANPTEGKFTQDIGNEITGSGTFTKSGLGDFSLNSNNTTFTGQMDVAQGVITQGAAGSMEQRISLIGSLTNPLSTGFATLAQNASNDATLTDNGGVTLNSGYSGIIAMDNESGTLVTTLTDNGELILQLGDFYQGSGNNNISLGSAGTLLGDGTINLISAGGESVVGDTFAAASGQILSLLGNNTHFTGSLDIVDAPTDATGNTWAYNNTSVSGYKLVLGNALGTGATITAGSTPKYVQEITLQGLNTAPTINAPTVANGYLATYNYGGLLALTSATVTGISSEAAIGDGYWYVGATTNTAFDYTGLTAGAATSYRLGGGAGTLFVGNADELTGANNLLVGFAPTTGGTASASGAGTVQFGAAQSYTGSTDIINGTLQLGAVNAINDELPSGTVVSFGASGTGSNAGVSGNAAVSNGTLDLNGTSVVIAGLSTAGLTTTAIDQIVTNSSSSTSSTLTVAPTLANPSSSFGGVIQNGANGQNIGLVLNGIASGTLALGGTANTFSGGLTITSGDLQIGTINNASTAGVLGNNGSVTLGGSGSTGILEYTAAANAASNMPFSLVAGGNGVFQVDTAGTVLTLSGNITGSGGLGAAGLGAVNLTSSSNGYSGLTTVASTATLQIGATGALPSGNSVTDNGNLQINANSTAGTISGTGTTTVAASTTLGVGAFAQTSLVNNGTTTITGAGTVDSVTGSTGSLVIGNGSSNNTVQLVNSTPLGVQSSQASVSVTTGSTLDITNNSVILNTGTPNPSLTTYQTLASNGYNNGNWNGTTSITSSWVATQDAGSGPRYGVAVVESANDYVANLTSSQIEITPALLGDTNVDGVVDFTDYLTVSTDFGKTGQDWEEGNFDYSPTGTVDFTDYLDVATNFGDDSSLSASDLASMESFANENGYTLIANADNVGFQVVAVPEPASLGLLATAGLGILSRRRRRQAKA